MYKQASKQSAVAFPLSGPPGTESYWNLELLTFAEGKPKNHMSLKVVNLSMDEYIF
jgi:hypothetical protein